MVFSRRDVLHSGHELAMNKVWYLAGEQLDMYVTSYRAQGHLLKRKPEIIEELKDTEPSMSQTTLLFGAWLGLLAKGRQSWTCFDH